jgi:ZIP family zinc transporter
VSVLEHLAFVFVAGLLTALATGLGALPFFFVKDISDRWTVGLWGLASGIMVAASVFGLLFEATAYGTVVEIGIGVAIGVALVVVADHFLHDAELDPGEYEEADFKKLVLILGILTVHSFPEGVAVGVAFAGLDFASLSPNAPVLFGFGVPLLGIVMTVAIAIHNIPEGVSISIPLRNLGVSPRRMVGWSVFSSLPQPIGAVLAFLFVSVAEQMLPIGFGFAAGAMIYLVATEFIPEALEEGAHLPSNGYTETVTGFLVGVVLMAPFLVI